MRIRTQITQAARERGMTAAEVARRLRLYRSNISAMDAGRRGVSLQALSRVAELLDCSPADLIEMSWAEGRPVFRSRLLCRQLRERERNVPDGSERGWVHAALLAWQRHYGASRKKAPGARGRPS